MDYTIVWHLYGQQTDLCCLAVIYKLIFTFMYYDTENQYEGYELHSVVSDFGSSTEIVNISSGIIHHSEMGTLLGSALIREISTVLVPAAVWLFASGLICLFGISKRNLKN